MNATGAASWPRLADVTNALGVLTILPLARPDPRGDAVARASQLFPVCGLLIGAALAATERYLTGSVADVLTGTLLVLVWESISGFAPVRAWISEEHQRPQGIRGPSLWIGTLVLVALLVVKAASLQIAATSRVAALLFAPTLGRWAIVVLATGARDASAPNRKFNASITFREFAVTSVFTFAVLFALAQATGILVAVCAAAVTLAARLLLHRWPGGVSWAWLLACCELVETTVVALFAALSR